MKYQNIRKAVFVKRHNRFVAEVIVDGETVFCHVKNTGRCGEIFLPGVIVYLEESNNKHRKYIYSLIAAEKNGNIINVDSQAPNKAAYEYLKDSLKFDYIRPEYTWGNSRFDFYAEKEGKKYLIEVKGVTLERQGVAMFPDAPTIRGTKHVNELIKASEQGYETMILFIVQMKGITFFTPNAQTDSIFSESLKRASVSGVRVLAVDCKVTPDTMITDKTVEVRL